MQISWLLLVLSVTWKIVSSSDNLYWLLCCQRVIFYVNHSNTTHAKSNQSNFCMVISFSHFASNKKNITFSAYETTLCLFALNSLYIPFNLSFVQLFFPRNLFRRTKRKGWRTTPWIMMISECVLLFFQRKKIIFFYNYLLIYQLQ